MKNSRKILAFVLSVLIIASVMPMTFAADSGKADVEDAYVALGRFYGIRDSIYATEEETSVVAEEADKIMSRFDHSLYLMGSELGDLTADQQGIADAYAADIEGLSRELKAFISEKGYKAKIDKTGYYIANFRANWLADIGVEIPEDFKKGLTADAISSYATAVKVVNGVSDVYEIAEKSEIRKLQNAYDALAFYYNSTVDCNLGNHNSDGKAKDCKDGTHAFNCSFCNVKLDVKEHSFDKSVANGDATCDYVGTKTVICVCGAKDIKDGDEEAHDWVFASENESNCTVAYDQYGVCRKCGETKVFKGEINAKKHVDADDDGYCENCGVYFVVRCEFCGKAKVEGDYMHYVCMLMYYLGMLKNIAVEVYEFVAPLFQQAA